MVVGQFGGDTDKRPQGEKGLFGRKARRESRPTAFGGGARLLTSRLADARLPLHDSACAGFSLSSPEGGEGRGEEAPFAQTPLSPTLSPLVPRGEREKNISHRFQWRAWIRIGETSASPKNFIFQLENGGDGDDIGARTRTREQQRIERAFFGNAGRIEFTLPLLVIRNKVLEP